MAVAVAFAVLRAGDGGGDGIPVLTSNPPPGPCKDVSMACVDSTQLERRTSCPGGRGVVEALQVAGDGIDAVCAGANVGARSSSSNAGLLETTGVATTTTLFVIITGQIRHESEDATAACVTITSRVGVRLGKKSGASVW